MKKIFLLSAIAAPALLAASCTPDLDFSIPGDKVGFSKTDVVTEVSVYEGSCDISIIKSGKGNSSASVTLEICTESDIAQYNDSGADTLHKYYMCDASAFTLSESHFEFDAGQTRKVTSVQWDADSFARSYAGTDAVIAVKISDCSIATDTTRSLMLIHPYVSKLSFSGSDIKNLYVSDTETAPDYVFEGTGSIEIDKAIAAADVTVSLNVDESLIPECSAARGAEYLPAPNGLFKLISKTSTIKAGDLYGSFDYKINCSVLFNAEGKLINQGVNYMIPIAIKESDPKGLSKGAHMVSCVIVNIPESGIVNPPVGVDPIRIHGPWEVISGQENDMTHDPANENTGWYQYGAPRLVDWSFKNTTSDNSSGYFCTWWWTEPVFPMEFVFDCGEGCAYIFNRFYKVDAPSTQGQLREFAVYVAAEYAGADTDWKLAAEGTTDYKGWQAFPAGDNNTDESINNIINTFGYEIPFKAYTKGRYIKLVLVSKTNIYVNDGVKGGYLMEFFADGWEL